MIIFSLSSTLTKAFSKPGQTTKMDLFAKIVTSCQPLTISAKNY